MIKEEENEWLSNSFILLDKRNI